MDRRPVVLVLATLIGGLLLTNRPARAQNGNGWPWPAQDPWGDASVSGTPQRGSAPPTQMEREEQQAEAGGLFRPAPEEAAPAPTTRDAVSVAQLQHPLSRKGRRLLDKVESYLRHGQLAKAHEELTLAIREPSAEPYAHAILGAQYLRAGQAGSAVTELESAAGVLPIASIHSNLGYALCLTGQGKRGRQELEEALRLDGGSPEARFLMGVLLLNQKSKDHEAEYDLKIAQEKVRAAHLALAINDMRNGEMEAAQQEIRAYLGPRYDAQVIATWLWAAAAAADDHPAAAFGLHAEASDLIASCAGQSGFSAGCDTKR